MNTVVAWQSGSQRAKLGTKLPITIYLFPLPEETFHDEGKLEKF